jgi:hypothetical protein
MISELGPIHPGERPRPKALAAANLAANRPDAADLRRLARDIRPPLPEGALPASPPGLGGSLDVYASKPPHPDLPFLKPLSEGGLGQNINTVI